MSSNIQNSLFETMKIFSDNAKNTSNATLTIECRIKEIVNEGLGEYLAEYLGNTFSIFSNTTSIKYTVGDIVYVLVPEGDFTKTKMIIGYVNPEITTFVNNNELNNIFYEVSDNLINVDLGIIKMSSYGTTLVENQPISNFDVDDFSIILNDYLQDYNTFQFSFNVKTGLHIDQQNSGNYGVTLNIPLVINAAAGGGETEIVWKQYPLDTTNMLGNYYRFTSWTPQSVYFTIDTDQYSLSTEYLPTLSYYCYGFSQDESKIDIEDIQIKDLSLSVVQQFTKENESGTGLTLKATEGLYYSEIFNRIKTITPTLRINGKKINLKVGKCEVYWFKEDATIHSDSPFFCSHGGTGWKCLNSKIDVAKNEDGTETFNWDSSQMTLEVGKSEIAASARYKCVVIYNNIEESSIITLKNLDSTKRFSLQLVNGSLLKDTGYANIIVTVEIDTITDKEKYRNSIFYSWMRYDKNNVYLNDDDDFFEYLKYNEMVEGRYITEIRIPVNMIEDVNYLYCSPRTILENDKGELEEEILGTQLLTLSTSIDLDYNADIINDNIVYKYDSNGNSPAGDVYDGPSTSKVTSIQPLGYIIRKPNGEEFTDTEYQFVNYKWIIPKVSMFTVSSAATDEDEDNYYIEGYGKSDVAYKIASRYNVTKAKGNVRLLLSFQNKTITSIANISFIKDGEGGSNGTSYAARLTYGGLTESTRVPYGYIDARGVIQKLKFIYNTNNGVLYYYDTLDNKVYSWTSRSRDIYPEVYQDGVLLSSTKYDITYSLFDKSNTSACFNVSKNTDDSARLSLDYNNLPSVSNLSCNVLQAEITVKIGNDSLADKEEIIYAYYPLELTITNFTPNVVPSIDGGFGEVMYAMDGTNPSWDQTAPFKVNDDNLIISHLGDFSDYYTTSWTLSDHLTLKETTSEGAAITPDNKYDDGASKNYVVSTTRLRSSAISEINSKINELNAELREYQSEISQVDSNLGYLENFAMAYKEEEWNSKLLQIQNLLNQQTNAVYVLNRILNNLTKIKDYIKIQTTNGKDISICGNLINQISSLTTEIEQAVIQIQKLDGTDGYNYEDLISLANYKLSWSETIKASYVAALGLNAAINFELLVTDINNQIDEYQNSYNSLMQLESTNYITLYKEIVDDIIAMGNTIPNSSIVYDRVLDLKDKVLKYVNYLGECTSYQDIRNYIDLMYVNVLKSTFKKNGTSLVVNSIVKKEFEDLKNYDTVFIDNIYESLTTLNNILNTQGYTITHIRPIVFYYNRYSLSNINGWDGNKIETGANDEYLLAPQVGAGKKESDNSFTGIVIGQRNIKESSSLYAQTGLFGFYKGQQSMFLNAENGAAIFGLSNNRSGQIIIDPTDPSKGGLLYSGNYYSSWNRRTGLPSGAKTGNGMCINLSEGSIHLASTDKGLIYSGNHKAINSNQVGFYLSNDGLSLGSQFKALPTGVLYIGKNAYNASEGSSIKCWTIKGSDSTENSYISYKANTFGVTFTPGKADDGETDIPCKEVNFSTGSTGDVYLGTDGIRLGRKFAVNADGQMAVQEGNFKGYLVATGGEFSGPIVSKQYIKGGKIVGAKILGGSLGVGYNDGHGNDVDMSTIPVKQIQENNFNFLVSNKGEVTITRGKITIGKWSGTGEEASIKNTFSVDNEGNIIAMSGQIGLWHIGTKNSSDAEIVSGDLWATDSTKGRSILLQASNSKITLKSGQGKRIINLSAVDNLVSIKNTNTEATIQLSGDDGRIGLGSKKNGGNLIHIHAGDEVNTVYLSNSEGDGKGDLICGHIASSQGININKKISLSSAGNISADGNFTTDGTITGKDGLTITGTAKFMTSEGLKMVDSFTGTSPNTVASRAWVNGQKFAKQSDLNTLSRTVDSLSTTVTSMSNSLTNYMTRDDFNSKVSARVKNTGISGTINAPKDGGSCSFSLSLADSTVSVSVRK